MRRMPNTAGVVFLVQDRDFRFLAFFNKLIATYLQYMSLAVYGMANY